MEKGLTVWETDFVVRGSGPFPFDMLRFDECWPVRAEDGNAMAVEPGAAPVTIRMRTRAPHPSTRPTDRRWESFGWKVVRDFTGLDAALDRAKEPLL